MPRRTRMKITKRNMDKLQEMSKENELLLLIFRNEILSKKDLEMEDNYNIDYEGVREIQLPIKYIKEALPIGEVIPKYFNYTMYYLPKAVDNVYRKLYVYIHDINSFVEALYGEKSC